MQLESTGQRSARPPAPRPPRAVFAAGSRGNRGRFWGAKQVGVPCEDTVDKIRELSLEETKAVAGGPLPLVGLALNLATRIVTNQLGQHAIRSAGLVAASYGTAKYLSGD